MIKQETLPPLTISTGDYDRLTFLASFGLNSWQDRPAAAMLADELIRATVLMPGPFRPPWPRCTRGWSIATMPPGISGARRWSIPMRIMGTPLASPCCLPKARR